MRAKKVVTVRSRADGPPDRYGNATHVWAEPVDHLVYGWAPAGTGEPFLPQHERVQHDRDIYAPVTFRPGPYDRITFSGESEEYEVMGEVMDYTNGPFGPSVGGVVVRTKRVTG